MLMLRSHQDAHGKCGLGCIGELAVEHIRCKGLQHVDKQLYCANEPCRRHIKRISQGCCAADTQVYTASKRTTPSYVAVVLLRLCTPLPESEVRNQRLLLR